jgi:hypothetical protein
MLPTAVNPQQQRIIHKKCHVCHGEGVLLVPMCADCQEMLTADTDWWQTDSLPCDHKTEDYLIEAQQTCQACAGQGWYEYYLTEHEYRVLRRQKIVRGIFLLLLALLPFIVLLIAIISREPGLMFGNWWY